MAESDEEEDTNLWDLAAYVENHPDDYGERWRLAKKFYKAWEYRLALEHLQVLKNEWKSKRNVIRYLAATYFRLTRYESAVHELEEAIKEWPEEVALYIQLAEVLDVGGTPHEALGVWKDVLKLEPDHAVAKRAISKLSQKVEEEIKSNKVPSFSSADDDPIADVDREDIECPNCGSKNSPEFKLCWNCHSALGEPVNNEEAIQDKGVAIEIPWGTLSGLTIAGLLALSAYLTLNLYAEIQELSLARSVPSSTGEFLARDLLTTRISIGIVALVIWPVIWRIAASFVGDEKIYNGTLYRAGALMALSTYTLTWVPQGYAYCIPLLPAVLSGLICLVNLRKSLMMAAALWLTQGLIMTLLVAALAMGQNGLGLVFDFVTIVQHSAQPRDEADYTLEGPTPLRATLRWASSDSTWLDGRASSVGFLVESAEHEGRLLLEIQKDGQTLAFKEYLGDAYEFEFFDIEPGADYLFTLTGEENVETEVVIRSVLSLE